MEKKINAYILNWQHIDIEIRYCAEWSTGYYKMAHLEIRNINGNALPMTETGYRSHFIPPSVIEEEGGPISYVRKWLEHVAKTKSWKNNVLNQNQLELF